MAQKTPGAPASIRNDNNLYGQNICPMGKKSFQEVTESFSNRVDEFQEYLFFCDNLIYNGFLTRKNYVYKPFMEHFSEDDEVKLLQLLGGDK